MDDAINLETDDVVTTYTYTPERVLSTDAPGGLLASITDALGVLTQFDYDERGNLLEIVSAVGTAAEASVAYTYGATTNWLLTVTDELGRVTTFTYDAYGRPVTTTLPDPDGGGGPLTSPVLTSLYNEDGELFKTIDPLSRQIAYDYDGRGNPTQIDRPDHDSDTNLTTTAYAYNAANWLISMTDPLGRVVSYEYDDAGRLIEVTLPDPDGVGGQSSPVVATTYDNLGRVKTTTDALLNVTTYAYSNWGKTVTITLPDPDAGGSQTSPVLVKEYDSAGNLVSETDGLNNETTYEYDELGRLVLIVSPDPDGVGGQEPSETEYLYDKLGNLVQIIDPLLNRIVYEYDPRGRKISERRSTGQLPTIGVATTTEATSVNEVQLVGFSADMMLSGGTFTLTYSGQTTSGIAYNASAATVQSALEALSNIAPGDVAIAKTTDTASSQVWQITFTGTLAGTDLSQTTIDASGVMGMMSVTETETTTTTGSATSEVQLVTLASATGGTFKLDFNGQLTAALGHDATAAEVDTALEALSNLDTVTVTGNAGGPFTITFTGTHTGENVPTLWPLATTLTNAALLTTTLYAYDDAGQLLSVTDVLGRVTSYQYDNLGRLTKVTQPDPDGAGGQSAPETDYAYDAANRLISVTDALGNVTEYDYDLLDHQVLVTLADPDGGGSLTSPELEFVFDAAGQLLESIDALGRDTDYEYDGLGRQKKVTQPDPDGVGGAARPFTTFTYDAAGNLLTVTDALSHVTEYAYDNLYRRTLVTDAELGETSFTFDAMGRMLSLTDPVANTTEWVYDNLGRKIEETNELSKTRTFKYDAIGNLTERIDRLGRKIVWEYDDLYRNTAEKWYDGINLVRTLTWEYDAAGQLTDAYDPASDYSYIYDNLGRLESESQSLAGLSPLIVYDRTFDAASNVTGIQAAIGGTADFKNTFTRDNLSRITRLEQQDQSGGNTVADKRFDFAYDASGAFTRIDRYADLAGTEYVASTHYAYDGIGRLLRLTHNDSTTPASGWGNNPLAGYQFTYDAASRFTGINSYLDGQTDYTHDDTNQLTDADHTGQTDEAYAYDANGNRIMTGYVVGANNRISSDGTFDYEYDDEGNRTAKETISTGAREEYTWDHRNRLTQVTFKNGSGTVIKTVAHAYDINNRWIRRTIDPDGATGSASLIETFFSHLDGQIALEFDGTTASDLSHRYVWNPSAVDQLMADENALNEVLYPFNDHLGTTRDLAEYDNGPDAPSVVNHRRFDSYGNIISETNGTITILIGYTGRPLDTATGLQNNWNRWYVSLSGVWMSEDPVGFEAGDANIYRYVHSQVLSRVDPTGLWWVDAGTYADAHPPIDVGPTFDQTKAIAIAGGDPLIEAEIAHVIRMAQSGPSQLGFYYSVFRCWRSWSPKYWNDLNVNGQGPCFSWVRWMELEKAFEEDYGFIRVTKVIWDIKGSGPGWVNHVAFRVEVSVNGKTSVFYVDNGWIGGSDHILFPEDIPGHYYNETPGKLEDGTWSPGHKKQPPPPPTTTLPRGWDPCDGYGPPFGG